MKLNRRMLALLSIAGFTLSACKPAAQSDTDVKSVGPDGAASTSMSGDMADKRGEAMVRVINAAPNMPGMIVRADDTRMLPAVDFGKVSAYQLIDGNWTKFEVGGKEGYSPLETNRELLADGHRYSLLVMRDDKGMAFKTKVYRDDISDDMSKAHLRVIHAAPEIGEVDVIAKGGNKIFEGVNYTSEAGFKDLDPWMGTLEFRLQDGGSLLTTMPDVNLKAGTSYSIVLTRNANGKVSAFWFEDTPM